MAYQGLCVGGPWAGRRRVNARPRLHAPLAAGEARWDPTEAAAARLAYPAAENECVYVWRQWAGLALWVPEGWDQAATLIELVRGYEAACQRMAPPATDAG